MPTKGGESLANRVSSTLTQLSAASFQLNSASDELGKQVAALDAALKKLNLGVSTWVPIRGAVNQRGSYWWREEIGYAKIGRKWGIALREISGVYNSPEDDDLEQWLFTDAPRRLRIDGVDKLPDLLEALVKETDKFTDKINTKTLRARELATAITAASKPVSSRQSHDASPAGKGSR